jgi:hypothetical protein
MSAIHVWHTVNNAPWNGDERFILQVKKEALKLAPPKKDPHNPVTLRHMEALRDCLDMFLSFDLAVWAVATCAFWGCCRFSELTAEFENHVDRRLTVLRYGSLNPVFLYWA